MHHLTVRDGYADMRRPALLSEEYQVAGPNFLPAPADTLPELLQDGPREVDSQGGLD